MTIDIQAIATSTPDDWAFFQGLNKVQAVNSPDDDDTSWIFSNGSNNQQQYYLDTNSIPPGSTINSVSIRSRSRDNVPNNQTFHCSLILGINSSDGPVHATGQTGYSTFTDTIARPGGGAWSLLDLTTLEERITTDNANSSNILLTSLWLIVDYTPPAQATGAMLLVF